jgi:hypothetical protein
MLGHSTKKGTSPEEALQNHWPAISRNDAADTIDLSLTVITQMVEAHTVVILFFDDPVERMLHAEELLLSQVALEHAELNALTKVFQDFVDTISPLVIVNVI